MTDSYGEKTSPERLERLRNAIIQYHPSYDDENVQRYEAPPELTDREIEGLLKNYSEDREFLKICEHYLPLRVAKRFREAKKKLQL